MATPGRVPFGERPRITMDKVPALAKDGKGALLTAQEVPADFVDRSSNPGVKYSRGKFLGKGGFAKCYEVSRSPLTPTLACKIVHKNMLLKEHHREKMAQEIMIHRTLKHRNIVEFDSYFEDDVFVYIVLELCEKKSLMELSRRRRTLTEPEARYFLRQICEGVRYLHDEKKIIHRDLKLGNIFISEGMELKIGDFGLATHLDKDGLRKRTMCGTPNYIAPEVLSKTGHGFEVDIWSIGCILYTLLIGKPPFETTSLKETYKKIRAGNFAIPRSNLTPQAKFLIQRLLQVDPSKRPTAGEILMDDFLAKTFIPTSLPVSALTMAPRFPSAAVQAKVMGRKPLQESQSKTTTVGGESRKEVVGETILISKAPVKMEVEDSVNSSLDSVCDVLPMIDLLKSLHTQIANVIERITKYQDIPEVDDESEDPHLAPMLSITKWVDYSDKYGFGYQLSDDSIGVTFNDQTKMILFADAVNMTYISREGGESYYTISTYPPILDKKVKLLTYFQKYMKENLLRSATSTNAYNGCIPRLPNMYTWFRTSRSVVMVLTNGTLQINNFRTHRKLVFCPQMGAVSIIEPNLPMRTYNLNLLLTNGCTRGMVVDLQYGLDKLDLICKTSLECAAPGIIGSLKPNEFKSTIGAPQNTLKPS